MKPTRAVTKRIFDMTTFDESTKTGYLARRFAAIRRKQAVEKARAEADRAEPIAIRGPR